MVSSVRLNIMCDATMGNRGVLTAPGHPPYVRPMNKLAPVPMKVRDDPQGYTQSHRLTPENWTDDAEVSRAEHLQILLTGSV